MLDSQQYIANLDPAGTLAIAGGQAAQLKHNYNFSHSFTSIRHVVLSGMGGSALAGGLIKDWLTSRLPVSFEVYRGYDIPAYDDSYTLFIASSYSGNTEETVASLKKALQRKSQIVVVSSGGVLKEMAEKHELPFIELPAGLQPRMAMFYDLRAIVEIFQVAKFVDYDLVAEIEAAAMFLDGAIGDWVISKATIHNSAKQIAESVVGFPVVIYGSPILNMASYKWKIGFNENAKQVAFSNVLSEMNHNEIEGWAYPAQNKNFVVIELRSALDNERIAKRFDVMNRLVSGQMPYPIEVQAQGETPLEHMLWTIALGDFVTLYTAILNGINPAPVPIMTKLKKELLP